MARLSFHERRLPKESGAAEHSRPSGVLNFEPTGFVAKVRVSAAAHGATRALEIAQPEPPRGRCLPMTRKVPWLAAAAFVCGAALIHFYLKRLEREISGGDPIGVLVAARDLQPGALLTQKDVERRPIPENYVGRRQVHAKDVGEVVGRPLGTALAAGEALLWSDVLGTDRTPRQLSELVTEGERGVTITSRAQLFEGLLRPGDRVDVLLTVHRAGKPETYTLLQYVRVLSVGGNLGDADGEARLGGTSVNVSVSLADAHTLAQADEQGRLSLVLRHPNDTHLTTAEPLPEAPLRAAPVPPRRRQEIEHVR